MFDRWIDRIGDVVGDADANDWIVALVAGTVALFVVWLVMRIIGFFFQRIGCLLALAVGVAVVLVILNQHGLPSSLGGNRIDQWIDELRDSLGV